MIEPRIDGPHLHLIAPRQLQRVARIHRALCLREPRRLDDGYSLLPANRLRLACPLRRLPDGLVEARDPRERLGELLRRDV